MGCGKRMGVSRREGDTCWEGPGNSRRPKKAKEIQEERGDWRRGSRSSRRIVFGVHKSYSFVLSHSARAKPHQLIRAIRFRTSFAMSISQAALREAWLGGREDRLCLMQVAKAWALREIFREIFDGRDHLPWVAERVVKNDGTHPGRDALRQHWQIRGCVSTCSRHQADRRTCT